MAGKGAGASKSKARKSQVINDENMVVDNPEPEVKDQVVEEVINIDTPEKATEVLKDYTVPDDVKTAYVCQDAQVFWDYNESSAFIHARQKGLKIFELKLKQ